MAAFDDDEYEQALATLNEENQRVDIGPTKAQRLGGFTIVCLVLNRTIGSGIFVGPAKVWIATGSAGASLMLWAAGIVVMTCGLLVWLELGLSVPLLVIPGTNDIRSVPRSGGEKNFIEFIFPRPKFLATCMYGIAFIVLGNLSGNALAFGIYITDAAGIDDPRKSLVIGLAVAALSACILLHICSRRGGIILNNMFAILKVILLIVIIILGLIKGSRRAPEGSTRASQNLGQNRSFAQSGTNIANYVDSLVYVMYTCSGFQQPFYVLSEVSRPRKNFPKYTLIAMAIVAFLYLMTNVAYFFVVHKSEVIDGTDIATAFLEGVFNSTQGAQRAMAALVAISIFGNLLVMTFTASRVKQEIAKEGIIPFSLFFASCHSTPIANIQAYFKGRSRKAAQTVENHLEQTPIAALLMHWIASIILIAVTSMMTPQDAYSVLVTLYSYVIVVGMGFVVASGLLWVKIFGVHRDLLPVELENRRKWSLYRNFRAWIDPVHAIVFALACAFMLIGRFLKPTPVQPTPAQTIPWFIVPAIGQSAWLWGALWFVGLHGAMWQARKMLTVSRIPFITPDEDDPSEWVQRSELINHEWHVAKRVGKSKEWQTREMT